MATGKLVLGVLTGFAAGAVASILLAPEKGSETRRRIAYKADSIGGDLEEKFNEFKESVTRQFDELRNHTAQVATDAQQQQGAASITDTTPAV